MPSFDVLLLLTSSGNLVGEFGSRESVGATKGFYMTVQCHWDQCSVVLVGIYPLQTDWKMDRSIDGWILHQPDRIFL